MQFKNLKLAIRRLKKTKLVSLINILGLTISITSFLLIVNYVYHETRYDQFHANANRIYRAESLLSENNHLTDHWASSPFGCATALKNELTGIEETVRITVQRAQTENIVSTGDIHYREYKCCYTEPSLFKVFTFNLIKGNPNEALTGPNKVVITEQMAHKYFGSDDPIGKTLKFSTENRISNCEVTGIMKDIPTNSHIHFDFFISWETLPQFIRDFWPIFGVYTYTLLKPGISPESIQQQFSAISEKYSPLMQMDTKSIKLALVPLNDIHFNQQLPYEIEQKGSRSNVYILSVIALTLLVIAWLNYINLSTALIYERIKEYTVRKLSGASLKSLIPVFIHDSLLTNLIAIGASMLLSRICLPWFNRLTGQNLDLKFLTTSTFWLLFPLIVLTGVIITGIAPALFLRKINPSHLINGRGNPRETGWGRKIMVCFQFAASISLIVITLLIFKQINFMQTQKTGYNADQTLAIKFPGRTDNYGLKMETFCSEVKRLPGVKATCMSGVIPGMEVANYAATYCKDDPDPTNQLLQFYPVDYDFCDTYDIKLVAGHLISKDYGNDNRRLMINQQAANYFGFSSPEEAIGKILVVNSSDSLEVAGVVSNFHQQSLDKAFLPIIFIYQGTLPWLPSRFVSVKISGNITNTVKEVERKWAKFFPDSSFDHFFVDEFFNRQYQSNIHFGSIFSIFSSLMIFVACLGLFALSVFSTRKRIKEIGIRKVNGARVTEIIAMLNCDFLKWIATAFVIAVPIAWYLMRHWLENFAYKTTMSWWIFALAGLLALGIALLTVSWQSWRAATKNPVEALRYE